MIDIRKDGKAITCYGNPAGKTAFRIECVNPVDNCEMVGPRDCHRPFTNWASVIDHACPQAGSRIIAIEVMEE